MSELDDAKAVLERYGLAAVPIPAAETLARHVEIRIDRDRLLALARQMAQDPSTVTLLLAAEARAEKFGSLYALCDRALRLTLAGSKDAPMAVKAWQTAVKEADAA